MKVPEARDRTSPTTDRLALTAHAGERDQLCVRIAESEADFERIPRLNHRIFTAEIPQHPPREDRRLVDRRLEHSTCLIALKGQHLVGMVAISQCRPFSVEEKLGAPLEHFLPATEGLCEVRLLAVDPRSRGGAVFGLLLAELIETARERGIEGGVISAHGSQTWLYRHLGFEPFGPPIGTPSVPYTAMLVDWNRLDPGALRLAARRNRRQRGRPGGAPRRLR